MHWYHIITESLELEGTFKAIWSDSPAMNKDTNYWHLGHERKRKVLSALWKWFGSTELSMSSMYKYCFILSTFEASICSMIGVPLLMDMCQGLWNREKLLYAMHALAHRVSKHVTAIKKERNCTELADVTGSLLVLARICSGRVSERSKGCCWRWVPLCRAVQCQSSVARAWGNGVVVGMRLLLVNVFFFFSSSGLWVMGKKG